MKKFNAHVATGTADGVTAGSAVNGNALFLGKSRKEVADLSALITIDAETSSLTFAAQWQASNDKSTWYVVSNAPANTAATVLATGTGGADAAVSRVIPSPDGLEGFQYARLSLVVGGATGATVDTYSIGYNYRKLTGAELGL